MFISVGFELHMTLNCNLAPCTLPVTNFHLTSPRSLHRQLCMARPCLGPALAVDSDLKLETTCMHMASSELLTPGHPIRNQAIPYLDSSPIKGNI